MGGISERGCSDEDGADASGEEIGATTVNLEAELAAQTAQPADGRFGPGEAEMVDEHGGEQDQQEEAAQRLQLRHAHVLDIQAVLLIEAIGVFDLEAVVSVGVGRLRVQGGADGDVGEEHEVAVQVGVMGDEQP